MGFGDIQLLPFTVHFITQENTADLHWPVVYQWKPSCSLHVVDWQSVCIAVATYSSVWCWWYSPSNLKISLKSIWLESKSPFKASVVISYSILLLWLLTHELWVWFTKAQAGLGSSVLTPPQGSQDGAICSLKQIWGGCYCLLFNMTFNTARHKLKPNCWRRPELVDKKWTNSLCVHQYTSAELTI